MSGSGRTLGSQVRHKREYVRVLETVRACTGEGGEQQTERHKRWLVVGRQKAAEEQNSHLE
jgi:hypothetical protein